MHFRLYASWCSIITYEGMYRFTGKDDCHMYHFVQSAQPCDFLMQAVCKPEHGYTVAIISPCLVAGMMQPLLKPMELDATSAMSCYVHARRRRHQSHLWLPCHRTGTGNCCGFTLSQMINMSAIFSYNGTSTAFPSCAVCGGSFVWFSRQ